ncbi:hypothetical protein SPHINGO8AM_50013 [Sphingomonas sp. 8AM]|nr:hypothetical protein SPHINGO8AM_50013 [Sphingomonas sp. 8AM]
MRSRPGRGCTSEKTVDGQQGATDHYISERKRPKLKAGAPDWIRTSGLCLRRAALYPAELRVPVRSA